MSNKYLRKVLTLCMVRQGDLVLLGMKKRGFGAGFWNGFGGKVEEGESIESAAARELWEEAGIVPRALLPAGVLEFEVDNDSHLLEVHVFLVDGFDGEVKETDEMRPRWFEVADIPYDKMWADDMHWLPMVLAGQKVESKLRKLRKQIK